MSKNILLVAVGGAAGSVLRYLVSVAALNLLPPTFPFGTFLVNLLGCFAMGGIVAFADREAWPLDGWRVLLTAGFCGGFTTFSAFAFENLTLLIEKNYLIFGLYAIGSVALGIAGALAGFLLLRG